MKSTYFARELMQWYETNHRPMPWKEEKNPYLIWLSEIILQQTRVAQGLPYYERFCAQYPTVFDLAKAPEDEVMKLWEGLGYYSRARNLHFTAQFIVKAYQGKFPDNYKDILGLKGVGPYTAAAIASFAYNLPHAVVDGNVYRVLSRFFGIHTPIDTTEGKKEFATLAQTLLDSSQPGRYNQAIIDFGAVQCTPKTPLCTTCPLQTKCVAFAQESVNQLPQKIKRIKKRTRYFNYLVLNEKEQVWIQKRTTKDIWQNLYEFPLLESEASTNRDAFLALPLIKQLTDSGAQLLNVSKPFQQQLTHQKIVATFWEFEGNFAAFATKNQQILTERKKLRKFAFPKIIDWYLQDNSLYLELF